MEQKVIEVSLRTCGVTCLNSGTLGFRKCQTMKWKLWKRPKVRTYEKQTTFDSDRLHAFLLISSTRTCNTLKTICVPIRHPKCRFDSYSWMKPQLSSQSLLQPADRRDSHRELGWTPAQSQDSWCFHFVLTVRFHVCIIMRYVSKLVLTNRFPRCLATNCTPEHAPPPSLQLYRCDVQCVFV